MREEKEEIKLSSSSVSKSLKGIYRYSLSSVEETLEAYTYLGIEIAGRETTVASNGNSSLG